MRACEVRPRLLGNCFWRKGFEAAFGPDRMGEKGGYHQLRRAVAYANFGKLRFKTEYEQQIWGECSRLITNCIIFYNTTILSRLLDHAHRSGDKGWADRISRASPVAWQHINFYGRYEFGKPAQPIDVEKTVQELAQQFKK